MDTALEVTRWIFFVPLASIAVVAGGINWLYALLIAAGHHAPSHLPLIASLTGVLAMAILPARLPAPAMVGPLALLIGAELFPPLARNHLGPPR